MIRGSFFGAWFTFFGRLSWCFLMSQPCLFTSYWMSWRAMKGHILSVNIQPSLKKSYFINVRRKGRIKFTRILSILYWKSSCHLHYWRWEYKWDKGAEFFFFFLWCPGNRNEMLRWWLKNHLNLASSHSKTLNCSCLVQQACVWLKQR